MENGGFAKMTSHCSWHISEQIRLAYWRGFAPWRARLSRHNATSSGSTSMPSTSAPRPRATTMNVPDPQVGSSTRSRGPTSARSTISSTKGRREELPRSALKISGRIVVGQPKQVQLRGQRNAIEPRLGRSIRAVEPHGVGDVQAIREVTAQRGIGPAAREACGPESVFRVAERGGKHL